jgi:hypothetical protein
VLAGSRLGHEGPGVHIEQLSGVLQRDRLAPLGIVNFRNRLADLRVRGPVIPFARVLIRPGEDQDLAVRKGDGRRIPALVLNVRAVWRIGVGLVEGVTVGDRAGWISLPARPNARGTPRDPLFLLGIKDVDLPPAVVAALVVEPEHVDVAVDPGHLSHAEEVVAEPPGEPGVLEEWAAEGHVVIGERGDARLGEGALVDQGLEAADVDNLSILAVEVGAIAGPTASVQLAKPESSLDELKVFRVESRKHPTYRRIQVVFGLEFGRSHQDDHLGAFRFLLGPYQRREDRVLVERDQAAVLAADRGTPDAVSRKGGSTVKRDY